jgi:RND family efflux transporter MFP subunit
VSRGRPLVRLNGPQALDLARETQTAEAALTLARQSAQRDRQLLQSGLIAKSRAEASDAALAQAESRARSAQRQQQLQGVQGEQSVQSLSSRSGGVVLEVLAAPGSRVGPGDPLLRLARTDALWLDIRLPAAQAGQVGVGSAVTVAGRTVKAQVTQIGQAVLPGTQSLLVRARVSAGGSSLRLGELVEARVRVASTADGVSVPSRGVWRDAGQTWAFVQTAPGRYRTVNIDVLSDDGSSVATRSLKAGDLVVVQGIAALKSLRAGT